MIPNRLPQMNPRCNLETQGPPILDPSGTLLPAPKQKSLRRRGRSPMFLGLSARIRPSKGLLFDFEPVGGSVLSGEMQLR